MTPLLASILRRSATPTEKTSFEDRAQILSDLAEAHAFECTAVVEAAASIVEGFASPERLPGRFCFLPAPQTWIEFIEPRRRVRVGFLLRQDGPDVAEVSIISYTGSAGLARLGLRDEFGDFAKKSDCEIQESAAASVLLFIVALLAMINSPRVIGRRSHLPHAGLQRRLARAAGTKGKFPLRPWTEILLKVAPPYGASNPSSARLVGAKALHFCRSHLRIRLGKLEWVRSHWRGNAERGICRADYRLSFPERFGAP